MLYRKAAARYIWPPGREKDADIHTKKQEFDVSMASMTIVTSDGCTHDGSPPPLRPIVETQPTIQMHLIS